MKFDGDKFLRSLFRNAGLLAPVLIVAALVSVFAAAQSARQLAASVAASSLDGKAKLLEVRRDPITPEQALRAARRLALLVPSVRVQVTGNSVVISAQNKEQFAEWMYALSSVQATIANVVWEPQHLCLSTCEGGEAARAYVTAFLPRLAATN
jgi:hypothetical protein